MQHYLLKNINNLQGAGKKGGGGGGGGPPPAELLPPKLGKLQALSSYSYAEIIDLVSDGPIEGLVNQNGQYVQGNRIFEGIYLDNTPIKKSFDATYTGSSAVAVSGYSLASSANSIYNLWFNSSNFQGYDFTGVNASIAYGSSSGLASSSVNSAVIKETSYFADNARVNDPYVALVYAPITTLGSAGNTFSCPVTRVREKQWEITWNRESIAKSIYRGIDLLKTVASSPSVFGETAADTAKAKILRYNYQNWGDVRQNLLPYYTNQSDDDYPIFAIKFEMGSPYRDTILSECGEPLAHYDVNEKQISVSSDFVLDKNTNTALQNDIANQVYDTVEIEEINQKRPIRPLQYLDLTYVQKTTSTNIDVGGSIIVFGFKDGESAPDQISIQAIKDYILSFYVVRPDNEKYNYNNILSEIRTGEDLQAPLSYFSKIYIDKEYGVKLAGPFDVSKQVLRVSNFDDDSGFSIKGTREFPLLSALADEGSSDSRNSKDFSSYAGNNRTQYIEAATPITHIIDNANVDQAFITIGVRILTDTNQVDGSLAGIGSVQAGAKLPSAVRFKVEIGLQDPYGKDVPASIEERIYQIVGLADSASLVDIGRSEVSNILNNYKFINGTRGSSEINASTAIILPDAVTDTKRFIRVTRTTYETSSVLLRREISLEKVTEIINTKFSYPNSAIIGTKIDSRNISSIPPRSFDLRLKRVLVPTNYFPLAPDGKDKRRYKTATEFNAATSSDLQIYSGNWDGTFKEAWTDNPAWVLFDILIDPEYGLGSFIGADQINIWELYKIGRFCDSVDKNGVFKGVTNSFGGKEPRYSINIIMADKINIFDTVNAIASVFRGHVFYNNSFIDFTDDRIKIPLAEFSNTNVKDGTFSYTNSRIDEQFNVVEVSYLDENDGFKPKIEYVENSEDIRKRGILRTTIDSFGVTSKTLANRIGKHVIYATTNENQAVSFIGGLESLYLKPGELISINDELKTLTKNFGRVLDVNLVNNSVYINEKFSTGACLREITLYAPTGKKSYDEMLGMARYSGGLSFQHIHESDVPQIQSYKITGYDNSLEYGSNIYLSPLVTYPLVTFTGLTKTGVYSGIGSFSGYQYYESVSPTGNSISRSGSFWYLRNTLTSGIFTSGCSGQSVPYSGSWASGGCYNSPTYDNPNIQFLDRVKPSYPFCITMSGTEREVYKVTSLKESNVNEYEVSAIKFKTGKFAEIEGSQNLDDFYDTFSFIPRPISNQASSAEVSIYQLDSPSIVAFQTGNYDGQNDTLDISGRWTSVNGASRYSATMIAPNGAKTVIDTTGLNYVFNDQSQLGFYRLNVSAKNPSLGYSSKIASSSVSVFATTSYITPYIKNITIA